MIPFTAEAFHRLVAQYNADLWPALAVAPVLAALWLWTGVVFVGRYLATLHWAAPAVVVLFAVEAVLLAWAGVIRPRLAFRFRPSIRGWSGLGVAAVAVVLHPLAAAISHIGWEAGRVFVATPTSLALLTVGVLLWVDGRVPRSLLVGPAAWLVAWGVAAWQLRILEDAVVSSLALIACILAYLAGRRRFPPP